MVIMYMVLGFGEETLFHRRGCYHIVVSLSSSGQRTEWCAKITKGKQGQGD